MDENGKQQAFVQVLDGKKQTAFYHQFEIACFASSLDQFQISIQKNHFSTNAISLDVPGIKGNLQFRNVIPWPVHWYSPGIMGPYAFVPFMECYHGIVSIDHAIFGHLEIDGERIDFDNGRGYTEKDWGRSFPSAYVWMQSNHFNEPGISIKTSVAKIPWIGSSFVGFIAGIWLHDRLIQFTTYNKSVLRKSQIDTETVELVMENKNHRLEIQARRDAATSLASPIRGLMDGRIEESMSSIIEVNLTDKKSRQSIFQDKGRNAGLEVAGNIREIRID
jgi:tocopherol cyclase